jgi:hypothetical protein
MKQITQKELTILFDKAWFSSKGTCPEPNEDYWAGVAHALGLAIGRYNKDIYLVTELNKIQL